MRILGCEADPRIWTSAMGLLAVQATVPLWRQSGVPRSMCEKPPTLRAIISPLRLAMIDASEEAGRLELRQRESGGDADIGKWYEAATERMATAGFAKIDTAFGLADARGLALWMVATEPGGDLYEAGTMWTHAFTLIADSRPSEAYVTEHVPELALPAIRAAFGERQRKALDHIRREVEAQAMSAEDKAILAWDPSSVDLGWPPFRDAVGDFESLSVYARARALAEVISRLMPEKEWDDLERLAQDWPG
jgi:hypothetical protein